MTQRPRLAKPVLDGTDVRALAEFYRELYGLEYRPGDEPPVDGSPDDADWLVLRTPDGAPALAFQLEPEHVAPTWPDPTVPMQAHLDTTVPDLESLVAARDEALRLGARLLREALDDPEEPIVVLADPAGHPFCVYVA